MIMKVCDCALDVLVWVTRISGAIVDLACGSHYALFSYAKLGGIFGWSLT